MSQKSRILREELSIKLGLLEIAQRVHCAYTGSFSELGSEELEQYLSVLRTAVYDWEPYRNEFEYLVRRICIAAINDGELLKQTHLGISA